jgi:hypothetical protein
VHAATERERTALTARFSDAEAERMAALRRAAALDVEIGGVREELGRARDETERTRAAAVALATALDELREAERASSVAAAAAIASSAALVDELRALRASTSWRVTRPLRAVKRGWLRALGSSLATD